MKVYLVIEIDKDLYCGIIYKCFGVFTSEEKAKEVCERVRKHFATTNSDPEENIFVDETTLDEVNEYFF